MWSLRCWDTVSVLRPSHGRPKLYFTLHFYFQAFLKRLDAREVTCRQISHNPTFAFPRNTFAFPRNNFCVPSQYSQSLSLMSSICVIVMHVWKRKRESLAWSAGQAPSQLPGSPVRSPGAARPWNGGAAQSAVRGQPDPRTGSPKPRRESGSSARCACYKENAYTTFKRWQCELIHLRYAHVSFSLEM